jgi:hypothetical protein
MAPNIYSLPFTHNVMSFTELHGDHLCIYVLCVCVCVCVCVFVLMVLFKHKESQYKFCEYKCLINTSYTLYYRAYRMVDGRQDK